jgi:hypothetical protein
MTKRLATVVAALLLGALAGASGCVDNRASIEVQHLCLPPTSCTFDATCAQYIGYPAFDRTTDATRPEGTQGIMSVYLQVANQLPENDNSNVSRLNTNGAHIDEIAVEYEGAVSGSSVSGASNFIAATSTGTVKVPLIMSGLATDTGEALARIRLRGYYDDGTRFETGEFPITISVCAGCQPATCGTADTCPPESEGQRPLVCAQ